MAESPELPLRLQYVFDLIKTQPPRVRELFIYALARLMVNQGIARVQEREWIQGREHLKIVTGAGDVFEVMGPQLTPGAEQRLLALVEEIMGEEL